jgi:hypothetical protein
MKRLLWFVLFISVSAAAQTAPRKRAVLIGIDDYSASTIPAMANIDHRGWPDLKGSANDAGILREMLVSTFGFHPADVVVLTNQQATRAAILRALEQRRTRVPGPEPRIRRARPARRVDRSRRLPPRRTRHSGQGTAVVVQSHPRARRAAHAAPRSLPQRLRIPRAAERRASSRHSSRARCR